jgi:4-hydroxybenzoate polyprenyltransferase
LKNEALATGSEPSSPNESPAVPVRGWGEDMFFFLKASRPGFWLTSIWFYLLPLARHRVFDSSSFWIGLLFVTLPLGLLIYGWNDILDAENDRQNPRKGTFLFGPRGTDEQLRILPWAIALANLPFLILFCAQEGPRMLGWYCLLVAATAIYNWPRVGFKNFPVIDIMNQLAYLLVFYLSSAINHVPQVPWATFLFGGLFAMHSHLLGEIFDVVPDRLAHRRTTTVVIGTIYAKYLLVAFLAIETLLVLLLFHDRVIGVFLACGTAWFLVDAVSLFRAQVYPEWLTRTFFIGWNIMALGSMWYVWSNGALIGLKY